MNLAITILSILLPISFAQHQATVPTDEAKLLVSRLMLSSYAVEDKDFIMDYHIYNIGDKPALQVILKDDVLADEKMEIVRGVLKVKWERIAPGTNVSHSVVLRPKFVGYFNYSVAEVSYLPSEESTNRRTVVSNPIEEGYIYRLQDFERRFSPRMVDWGCFALMTLPSLVMPGLLWFRVKSKYENISPSKKQN